MIRVDAFACFFCALLLLTLPAAWVFAAVFAAAFHELCHVLAILLTGNEVHAICIGMAGAEIRTEFQNRRQELLCALAGPVGSLMLVPLYHSFPRLALCGAVQGLFNLLPVYPMDGGRILACILEGWVPQHRERILRWTEGAVLAAAIIVCIRFSLGVFPMIVSFLLICRPFLRKIPCKPGRIRVQ